MALFEILRRGQRQSESLLLPNAVAPLGRAFQESATAGTAELADGTKPIAGFVTREVITALPTPSIAEMTGQGVQPLEQGHLAPYHGAFEDAQEVVAEGADYIFADDDPKDLTGATNLKTLCSFTGGKFCKALEGQYAEFMLVEKPTAEVNGNVRMRFIRVAGSLIPAAV